jgi:hypothetical protein
VASGRKFGFTDAGAFTTTPSATSNISGSYPLTSPLKRINAAALFKYEITPQVEIYGRAMFTIRAPRRPARRAPRLPRSTRRWGSARTTLPDRCHPQPAHLRERHGAGQRLALAGRAGAGQLRHRAQHAAGAGRSARPADAAIKWNVYAQYGRSTRTR